LKKVAIQDLTPRRARPRSHFLRHDAELRRRAPPIEHAVEQPYLSGIEAHPSCNGANQRRLAGAIGTEQRQQFPFAQLERCAVERDDRAELLAGVGDGEGRPVTDEQPAARS